MKIINKGLFTAIAVAILLLTGCHDTIDITKNSNENPGMDSTIISSRDENSIEISDTTNNISAVQSESSTDSQAQNTSNEVWIPQSGKKYHSKPGCSGMNNPSKVSLTKAESLGFTACKRCH